MHRECSLMHAISLLCVVSKIDRLGWLTMFHACHMRKLSLGLQIFMIGVETTTLNTNIIKSRTDQNLCAPSYVVLALSALVATWQHKTHIARRPRLHCQTAHLSAARLLVVKPGHTRQPSNDTPSFAQHQVSQILPNKTDPMLLICCRDWQAAPSRT